MDETTEAPTSQRIEEIRRRLTDNPDSEGGTVRDVEWVARQCKIAELAVDLLAAYDLASRERDSLARRLAVRFEDLARQRTVTELVELDRDRAADALRELDAIHIQSVEEPGWCDGCPGRTWPCRSRAVLDGVLPFIARGVS